MKKNIVFPLVLGFLISTASAQGTNKSIRLVIGFAPGGAADIVARAMSEPLSRALGLPVVVDNKPGNGSSIAADIVAHAPADGYTLLIASPSSISVNPSVNPKLGYTSKDLLPVTKMTTSPLILAVSQSLPIYSLKDLIAAARKNPEGLNYATSGNGSAPHLGAALLCQVAGIEMTHVPYRGGALAIQSVMAGDTQVTFGTSPSVLPQAKGGRLRILAVSTRERSPLVPEVPGMKEAGLPEYNLEFWYGMFLPAGTPSDMVKKVYDATITAMKQPSVKAALERDGTGVSLSSSPEEFSKLLESDNKFWVSLAKTAKVKVD